MKLSMIDNKNMFQISFCLSTEAASSSATEEARDENASRTGETHDRKSI